MLESLAFASIGPFAPYWLQSTARAWASTSSTSSTMVMAPSGASDHTAPGERSYARPSFLATTTAPPRPVAP